MSTPEATVNGILHVYVAFDWGEEIDLERARALLPAEVRELPRRRRTPSSISYLPPPLRFPWPSVTLTLPDVGEVRAPAEATVFDFAAVSLALQVGFQVSPCCLTRLAGWFAEPKA